MSSNAQVDATTTEETESAEQTQKSFEYRKGMKYQTMFADNRIVHESDVSLLPEGAIVIKSVYESTYEQVSYIVQHDYEMIIYKDKNGIICKGYFPKVGAETENETVVDCFPGTHASCSLLANLVFNKYHMNTPVYREMVRLLNNKMNVSRNTVYNWFVKGSEYLNKVLPILKNLLLAKDSVAHPDQKRPICGVFLPALLMKLGSMAIALRPLSPKKRMAKQMFKRSQLMHFSRLRPKF